MVIHLTGADTYRSAKRLADLRAVFVTKHDTGKFNVVDIDGETATVADVKNAVSATGMFSAKRFVSLDRYQPDGPLNLEVLTSLLESAGKKDSDVIVVIRDTIDDHAAPAKRTATKTKRATKKSATGPVTFPGAKREVFSRLTPAQSAAWISTTAKTLGETFLPAAAERLVALCNNDSWRLAGETDKLLSFAAGRAVTVDDVESMVTSESNSDIFALTDALGQRQSARALNLLHREFSAGTNEFALIATLAGHIRTLYYVKQALQRGVTQSALASALAIHPFVAQKAATQAPRFTSDQLRDLHHRLVTIDHDLKTSPLDAETLLDLLLVQP